MSTDEEYIKHKDEQPLQTIQRIRQMLHGLGILTTERWYQTGDSLYSVRVEIAGTDVGQNGKGTTAPYALASGYGEFMERLQLGTLYNAVELGPAAMAAEGFYYAPDEQYLSQEQVRAGGGPVVDYLLKSGAAERVDAKGPAALLSSKLSQWYADADVMIEQVLLEEWAGETPVDCPASFVGLPYYSLKEEKLFPIPVPMLRLPYLHNGAAAGNTPEEALVQAMSEILERYIHKKIMAGEVAPPLIPREYWQKNDRLATMVRQIEQQGYQVLVKDCSFDLGIPIIGMILLDQRVRSYFVKFGVHPSFDVALERCLTEAAQGRDLSAPGREWMTRFQYHDTTVFSPQNRYHVLRTGTGSYPQDFFAENSYEFAGYVPVAHLNNKELLNRLTATLLKISMDVLVRDVSYLGFPAFQVIAPGVSEVFDYDRIRLAQEKLRSQVRRIMKNLPAASPSQLHKVVSFLVKRSGYAFETDCLSQLPGILLRGDFFWNQTPNYELIGAALYKMGKVAEAAGIFRQLAQSPGVKGSDDRDIYYSAVSDYLAARAEGRDEQDIQSLLGVFYDTALLMRVVECWQDPEGVLDSFGSLPCWDCPNCSARAWCSREKLFLIHQEFKKRQRDNPLDQMNLQQLFGKMTGRVSYAGKQEMDD